MRSRDILVPLDFSENSLLAIDAAAELAGPEGQIYLLHVVDTRFIEQAEAAGLGGADEVTARLRSQAEDQMQRVLAARRGLHAHIESMVASGRPFAEILRLVRDLDFDMIVLSCHGQMAGVVETLLFGSTAEKVLRASPVPVLCVPCRWQREEQPAQVVDAEVKSAQS